MMTCWTPSPRCQLCRDRMFHSLVSEQTDTTPCCPLHIPFPSHSHDQLTRLWEEPEVVEEDQARPSLGISLLFGN